MILIAMGANLEGPLGPPLATIRAALALLPSHGVEVKKISSFYRTEPVPASDQPWYVNGVAVVETGLTPSGLLSALFAIEKKCGRDREQEKEKNAARVLDLDVLDYEGRILDEGDVIVPHPRLAARAFVLFPLRDVAPDWRHPLNGLSVSQLLSGLTGIASPEKILL